MSVKKIKNPPVYTFSLEASIIKQVDSFNHDGKCDWEIKWRVTMAKATVSNMLDVFKIRGYDSYA